MSRVKIEDLKPPAKDLDVKEMKKLYGGSIIVGAVQSPPIIHFTFQNVVPPSEVLQALYGDPHV
jgi:hypothetical protein